MINFKKNCLTALIISIIIMMYAGINGNITLVLILIPISIILLITYKISVKIMKEKILDETYKEKTSK